MDILTAIKEFSKETIKDYGDLSLRELSSFFDKELLVDIPYISTAVNLASLGGNIKKAFLVKKLIRFLKELNSISHNERKNFVIKLESSEESKKIGDKLLVIIDSLDDDDKATILGKLFKRVIEGNLEISDFHRIALSVNRIYYGDLKSFEKEHLRSLPFEVLSSLYQSGFLTQIIADMDRQNRRNLSISSKFSVLQPQLTYRKSTLGELYLSNIKE